jgi:pilus assembly protein Flp/PilA
MSNKEVVYQEVLDEEVVIEGSEKKERGASMVEYALLVALIAVISIVAIRTVGQQVSGNFSNIQKELKAASTGSQGGTTPGN